MGDLVIYANLGGVCRLRLVNDLLMEGDKPLKATAGDKPNPFFKQPRNQFHTSIADTVSRTTRVYDLPTETGKTYVLVTESGRNQTEKKR